MGSLAPAVGRVGEHGPDLLQPVSAGLFVTGEVGYLDLHSLGHLVILGMVVVQVIVAILAWRPGRAPGWPIWTSVALFLVVEMQAGFGYTRDLSLHIPGGVLVFGLMIAVLIGTWAKVPIRRPDRAPTEQTGESA